MAATWLSSVGDVVLAVRPREGDTHLLPGGVPEAAETFVEAVAREVPEGIVEVAWSGRERWHVAAPAVPLPVAGGRDSTQPSVERGAPG